MAERCEYEVQRMANIIRNNAKLVALGLETLTQVEEADRSATGATWRNKEKGPARVTRPHREPCVRRLE